MSNPETASKEPEQSKRPSKNEGRVYLEDAQNDFLAELQRRHGFQFKSDALRYCISKVQALDRDASAKRRFRQRRKSGSTDRQPTGTP